MSSRSNPAILSPQLIFLLSIVAGTLAWELLAAFLALGGIDLGLTTGPVGFDAGVISFFIEVNPGTFLGLFLGYRFGRAVAGSGGSKSRRRGSSSRSARAKGGGGATGSGARGSGKATSGTPAGGNKGSGEGDA